MHSGCIQNIIDAFAEFFPRIPCWSSDLFTVFVQLKLWVSQFPELFVLLKLLLVCVCVSTRERFDCMTSILVGILNTVKLCVASPGLLYSAGPIGGFGIALLY